MTLSPFEVFLIKFIIRVIGLLFFGIVAFAIAKGLAHILLTGVARLALWSEDRNTARIRRHYENEQDDFYK
jgi:hypothetical protein